MPKNRYDAATARMRDGFFNRSAHGTMFNTGWTVVHEIHGHESGYLSNLLLNPVRPGQILLSREDLFSVNADQVAVQCLGICICVAVDEIGVDVVGWPWLRRAQLNIVDQIPGIIRYKL